MADYVNLDSVHTPGDGELVPAAWGHAIRQNFDAMHRPYAFQMIRSLVSDSPLLTIATDTVVELGFNYPLSSTGDSFTMTDEFITTFTVPADGYYFASANVNYSEFAPDPLPNPNPTIFAALMFKDDTDDSHYLLRRSVNIDSRNASLSGLFRAEAGMNLSFVTYQDTGADAKADGFCALVYTGRKL